MAESQVSSWSLPRPSRRQQQGEPAPVLKLDSTEIVFLAPKLDSTSTAFNTCKLELTATDGIVVLRARARDRTRPNDDAISPCCSSPSPTQTRTTCATSPPAARRWIPYLIDAPHCYRLSSTGGRRARGGQAVRGLAAAGALRGVRPQVRRVAPLRRPGAAAYTAKGLLCS